MLRLGAAVPGFQRRRGEVTRRSSAVTIRVDLVSERGGDRNATGQGGDPSRPPPRGRGRDSGDQGAGRPTASSGGAFVGRRWLRLMRRKRREVLTKSRCMRPKAEYGEVGTTMDSQRFEGLTRVFASQTGSRRKVLRALIGGALGGVVATRGTEQVEAQDVEAEGGRCGRHKSRCGYGCCRKKGVYCCIIGGDYRCCRR